METSKRTTFTWPASPVLWLAQTSCNDTTWPCFLSHRTCSQHIKIQDQPATACSLQDLDPSLYSAYQPRKLQGQYINICSHSYSTSCSATFSRLILQTVSQLTVFSTASLLTHNLSVAALDVSPRTNWKTWKQSSAKWKPRASSAVPIRLGDRRYTASRSQTVLGSPAAITADSTTSRKKTGTASLSYKILLLTLQAVPSCQH